MVDNNTCVSELLRACVLGWAGAGQTHLVTDLSEEEGEQREDDEVDATGEVGQLVHLEGGGDREEDELHAHRHDRAHRQVINVQDLDRHGLPPRCAAAGRSALLRAAAAAAAAGRGWGSLLWEGINMWLGRA